MISSIKRALRRFDNWIWPRPLYVVVYDGDNEGWETEEYYDYFSSPAEARMMFETMRGRDPKIKNARICQQVEIIPDIPDTESA